MDNHQYKIVLTLEETCEIARIGRSTLYRSLRSGALRARKIGKKTVVLREDLQAWLQSLPTSVPVGARSEMDRE
jgi:excisionase family DNA binding protein